MLKKSNPAPTGNRPAPTPNPPRPPIDGCTESHCPRCRTHPAHRGDMEHAGIGDRPSAVEARDAQRDIGSEPMGSVSTVNGVEELAFAEVMAISKEMFRAGFRSGMAVSAASQAGKLPLPGEATAHAVSEAMIDRVMPDQSDTYPGCPLCDYTGAWNASMTATEQRKVVRELLEKALAGENSRRDAALETLKSVLCDPSGAVAAGGSDADRMLIAGALDALTQPMVANSDPGATASAGASLTNPHTGQPRDYRDVESDPEGRLIVKPGEPLWAASAPEASQEAAGLDAYDDALDQLWKLAGGNDHPVYKRFLEFRETFAATVTAAPADLIERCREILAWQRTGVLQGDALRAYANARWPDEHDPLQIAEKETAREAFRILAKAAAASTPAAPGIDLHPIRYALKYAAAAARENTHSELAEDFDELIRKLDASPKGDEAAPLHAHYCNAQPASAECICGLNSPKGGSEAHSAPDAIDMDNRLRSYPWTYRNQPGNVGASVLGGCARRAQPGGDSIDHGLSLLRELHIQGLGIVRVPKLDVGTKASDAEVRP